MDAAVEVCRKGPAVAYFATIKPMGVPRNVAAREKTELEILRPRLDTELAATPGCVEPRSQPPKDGEELAIDLRVFGFGYGSQ